MVGGRVGGTPLVELKNSKAIQEPKCSNPDLIEKTKIVPKNTREITSQPTVVIFLTYELFEVNPIQHVFLGV